MSRVGVIAMEQYVYAVGGYDSTYQLPSVERYCVETNQWEVLSPMNRPRSALAVAVINNRLYAVGKIIQLDDTAKCETKETLANLRAWVHDHVTVPKWPLFSYTSAHLTIDQLLYWPH